MPSVYDRFKLVTDFELRGDQARAQDELVEGLVRGDRHQVLLGVTGSGKTFTMAQVIARVNRPTLVMVHNKTLAAQLYQEFKRFFPENAVEYFVSYYDYYQPEAYVPVERHLHREGSHDQRRDRPDAALGHPVALRAARRHHRRERLVHLRPRLAGGVLRDAAPARARAADRSRPDPAQAGRDPVRAQRPRLRPRHLPRARRRRSRCSRRTRTRRSASSCSATRSTSSSRSIRSRARSLRRHDQVTVFPKSHYVTSRDRTRLAVDTIREELAWYRSKLEGEGKLLEAQRLHQRTMFDLEMIQEIGYCHGIENYSRHLTGRAPGEPPPTLLDYLPDDAVMFIDESHQTIPQIRGMYAGDRSRKEVLVDYGFRLPSALDNRPLTFDEWQQRVGQLVYVSATPGPYEYERAGGVIVEQVIRPTGLMDPPIEVRPVRGQVDDLLQEIRARAGARRARAGDDADQEDGRGPDAVLPGARRQGALPALRHRDARARRDPARPAARRVRRARRHQPPARGPRPAGGVAGRDPRRRQGRLPPIAQLAHPDLRPRGAQRERARDHVRRPRNRLDAPGHRRMPTPPREAGRLQRGARHHADVDHQEHRRGARERVRARLPDGRRRPRAAAAVPHGRRARCARGDAAGGDAQGGRQPRLREGGAAARRDPRRCGSRTWASRRRRWSPDAC